MAIAPPQMRAFHTCCKIVATYMGMYCVATTIVSVFQCGPDLADNWIKAPDQRTYINVAAFWYAQFAIDITASVVMIALPWWPFASIQCKRKNVIDFQSIGLIVAQLQINFGCIAACVPTVLKLFEEAWLALGLRLRGVEQTQCFNASQQRSKSSGGGSTDIRLSALRSVDHGGGGGGRSKSPGPYLHAGRDDDDNDDDDESMGSQHRIM
ncbi:hypothetical protein PG994_002589 [Apiospora phragmitis]|uniref:Rhodopsin domain-containing protein n=1 Tax=Apiospora phragmitis TaxID=2905665 RepID=A0ABR1W5K6_9PEZI